MDSLQELFISFREEPTVEKASLLDERGFLPAPGEDLVSYQKRILSLEKNIENFRKALEQENVLEPYCGLLLSRDGVMDPSVLREVAPVTEKAYGFSIDWVPGFYPEKGLGLLWGGCSIDGYEEIPPLFMIRKSFRKKKRFFIYSREELTAHELCHVARNPIKDRSYEEHFAYAVSQSAFRRYTGNCFKTEKDALFFLLPVFAMLFFRIAQAGGYLLKVPSWPLWILIVLWPAWLLWNNYRSRKVYFRAEKALKDYTERPGAVLFRCTGEEIRSLGALSGDPEKVKEFLSGKKESDLRWQILFKRFVKKDCI